MALLTLVGIITPLQYRWPSWNAGAAFRHNVDDEPQLRISCQSHTFIGRPYVTEAAGLLHPYAHLF